MDYTVFGYIIIPNISFSYILPICNSACICDAFKPAATTERTINRHRDFSFFLDSGAAFIVTPLL